MHRTNSVYIATNSPWVKTVINEDVCFQAGNAQHQGIYQRLVQQNPMADDAQLAPALRELLGHYAAIFETRQYIFAYVDRVRSYPIFYLQQAQTLFIGNHPKMMMAAAQQMQIAEANCQTFLMSGYVHGNGTFYEGLHQLRAGEFLLWDKNKRQLTVDRYYQYLPRPDAQRSEADLLAEHDEVMNRLTQRMIAQAAGRPIWVALSGGFDSRLVLAKLKQHHYDNLHAFSYGVPHR